MTIGFIGAGNMGSALIEGNLKQGMPPEQIIAVESDADKRTIITDKYGIRTFSDFENTPPTDILVLSIKPQHLKQAIDQIKTHLQTRVIVSIAAGVSCQTLRTQFANDIPIVRAMPNTPAMVGFGMTGLYTPEVLNDTLISAVDALFTAVGKTLWVTSESLIDAVTAISGSGPAYFFYMMEALRDAGLQLGIDSSNIDTLVQQTVLGAAQLASATSISFAALRQQVTSKGGTTEAAIATLNSKAVNQAIKEAATAAYNRAVEMSKAP